MYTDNCWKHPLSSYGESEIFVRVKAASRFGSVLHRFDEAGISPGSIQIIK